MVIKQKLVKTSQIKVFLLTIWLKTSQLQEETQKQKGWIK